MTKVVTGASVLGAAAGVYAGGAAPIAPSEVGFFLKDDTIQGFAVGATATAAVAGAAFGGVGAMFADPTWFGMQRGSMRGAAAGAALAGAFVVGSLVGALASHARGN